MLLADGMVRNRDRAVDQTSRVVLLKRHHIAAAGCKPIQECRPRLKRGFQSPRSFHCGAILIPSP